MNTSELNHWLLTTGRQHTSIPELLKEFGSIIQTATGCSRIWLGTTVLHPQAAGYAWFLEDGIIRERIFGFSENAMLMQSDNPARRFKDGAEELNLSSPDSDGLEDVQNLFHRGYAEFFALPIHFQGEWAGAITYTSKTPYTKYQIELLRSVHLILCAVLEPFTCRLVTSTLLQTYLGADAGERVYLGQVKRGDGQSLRSVIWFSDIRGFTKMSERLELNKLLEVINQAFEQVVEAVEANGGQVLKFIGDGALAVFPCQDGDAKACHNAMQAALQMSKNLRDVEIGVGLHLGEVNYGNIGAPGRLDFTVIGSDVNLAARVEGQTGKLGKMILATPAVAEHGEWELVKTVELKGVAESVPMYAPKIMTV